ncbi:hypothetical protein D3C75_711500 [compost metagenome]
MQRIDKPGAGSTHVYGSGGSGNTEAVLQDGRNRRKWEVRCAGGDENHIDILHAFAITLHQIQHSGCTQITGIFILAADSAFTDSGPLDNPLIIGIHHLLQIAVRKSPGRYISSDCGNFGTFQEYHPII